MMKIKKHVQWFFMDIRAYITAVTRLIERESQNIIVYSCIFGDYEPPKEPLIVHPGVKYILFTDNPNLRARKWTVQVIPAQGEHPRRISRKPKILPHQFLPEHDISIYLDGTLELKYGNVQRLARCCLKGRDIALFKHHARNCTYAEGAHVVNVGKEHSEVVERQLARYRQEGFPENHGLLENAFIVRRNVSRIRQLNELWWHEYSTGSQRDQLSLMYCMWRLGIEASIIRGKQFRKSSFLRHHPHEYIAHLEVVKRNKNAF